MSYLKDSISLSISTVLKSIFKNAIFSTTFIGLVVISSKE